MLTRCLATQLCELPALMIIFHTCWHKSHIRAQPRHI
jgi:hypothetical protein